MVGPPEFYGIRISTAIAINQHRLQLIAKVKKDYNSMLVILVIETYTRENQYQRRGLCMRSELLLLWSFSLFTFLCACKFDLVLSIGSAVIWVRVESLTDIYKMRPLDRSRTLQKPGNSVSVSVFSEENTLLDIVLTLRLTSLYRAEAGYLS